MGLRETSHGIERDVTWDRGRRHMGLRETSHGMGLRETSHDSPPVHVADIITT